MSYVIVKSHTVAGGYSDCWYCGRCSVDADVYTVTSARYNDGPNRIIVCDAPGCVDRADSGTLDSAPDYDDDDGMFYHETDDAE